MWVGVCARVYVYLCMFICMCMYICECAPLCMCVCVAVVDEQIWIQTVKKESFSFTFVFI